MQVKINFPPFFKILLVELRSNEWKGKLKLPLDKNYADLLYNLHV